MRNLFAMSGPLTDYTLRTAASEFQLSFTNFYGYVVVHLEEALYNSSSA